MTDILYAYTQLNNWIEESQGKVIEIAEGIKYSFIRKRKFSHSDFKNLNICYPSQYLDFLINVGEVELFIDDTLGIEVLGVDKIKEFSKEVFEDYGDDLYPDILLTVSLPSLGYFGGFCNNIKGNKKFSIFYPDIPADLWVEEADFIDFNEWIIFLVNSKNQEGIY